MLRLANLGAVIHFENFLRCRWAAGNIASTLDKRVMLWRKPFFPQSLAQENLPIGCGQIYKLPPADPRAC